MTTKTKPRNKVKSKLVQELFPVECQYLPNDGKINEFFTTITKDNEFRFTSSIIHKLAAAIGKLKMPFQVHLVVNHYKINPGKVIIEKVRMNNRFILIGSTFDVFNHIANDHPTIKELAVTVRNLIVAALKEQQRDYRDQHENIGSKYEALTRVVNTLD